MKGSKVLRAALAMVGAAALVVAAAPHSASAQGFLDGKWTKAGGGGYRGGQQTVSLNTRYRAGTIVVSFGDRRLYYIQGKGRAISYPIGVPAGKASWSGVSWVSQKRVNPPWTPTPSMRRENPKLPAHMPGGHPRNPLGVRALYLGHTLYRIHGTDAPWTVGQNVTHGCIRLYNRDVIDLYNRARVGARVVVTWKRFNAI
ncbi:MAG: L,D-transpeptidase [Methyloligellaceae bacterium]